MKKGPSDFFKNFFGKKVEAMEDNLYNSSEVDAEQVSSEGDAMLDEVYIDSIAATGISNASMKR